MAATMEFAGKQDLVRRLDAAVRHETVAAVTTGVQGALTEIIGSGAVELPADVKAPIADGYGRRLLYKSPEHGYAVIAMVWGPHQGTALHDHDGVWCVEGVLEGEIDVVRYDLVEDGGERCRFAPQGQVRAGVGSSGALIPPFEYHTIANPCPDATSITVHVYGRELEQCTVFEPLADGWYRRATRHLGYH